MGHKSPRSHVVHKHERKGKSVDDYNRGKGDHRKASISEIKLLAKKGTIDEQGRTLKKIGERIGYTDGHKRVSGIVVGIRAEYYLVERNGKVWKVDRHSPFSRIGEALSGAGAKLLVAGKAGLGATKEAARKLAPKIKEAAEKGATIAGSKLAETRQNVIDSLERRAEEKRNWNKWKKEMEKEEKKILEKEKSKVKREEKLRKFRKRIREGPLWKRAVKEIGRTSAKALVKELKIKPKPKPKPKKKVKTKPKPKKKVKQKKSKTK